MTETEEALRTESGTLSVAPTDGALNFALQRAGVLVARPAAERDVSRDRMESFAGSLLPVTIRSCGGIEP